MLVFQKNRILLKICLTQRKIFRNHLTLW